MDIATWLRELGLERYEQAFRENEVDERSLPHLTADDLKEMGVVAIGHRRLLLQAIADLRRSGKSEAEPASEQIDSGAAVDEAAKWPSGAERRPLSVMFCDLADSTAFSARLDPEDLQDLLRAYRERCTAIVCEYGGFVAKYMGDGILVYFGYPRSLERNAERAVRTGLAIVEAMADLNAELARNGGAEIAVRIGIATGLVVVGEIVGEGLAQERTVIGEAPNVAARLQGIAPRNGIVIGGLTKEIVGDAFVYDDLGAHELKGFTGLVKVWAVVGLAEDAEEDAEGEASAAVGRLPLVGRDEEIGLLRRAWQQTNEEGRGRVVLVVGEPGIGKSALVETLRGQVREEGLARIAFHCSPYHTNSALYPVIEHLRRLVRWQPDDSPEVRLDKLEALLADTSLIPAEAVPLFAPLLSLPLPEGRYSPLDSSPEQLKQQTQDALIAWTLEDAERRPMLEVWEDLHWADPSTLELLGLLLDQAPTVPLLIVLTFRPDFLPGWPTRSHMTPITLTRLERPQIEAMVGHLARGKILPVEVVEHIVAKADGVPLYVEELTKAILDSEILRAEPNRYTLTGPLSAVSIPATLQESLMARLDRLPTVREVAQLGAVLGREFAYEMISAISTIDESALQEGLRQLVGAELLYQRGRPPRAKYTFKHALLHDAAYQSLLRRTRQFYHRKVAELLEDRYADAIANEPEQLAHHYTRAGLSEKATGYWIKAGQSAARSSNNQEAVNYLRTGLELIATLPDTQDRAWRELDAQMSLAPALMALKGSGDSVIEQTYTRALFLCNHFRLSDKVFPALFGLWRYYTARGICTRAHEYGKKLLEFALQNRRNELLIAAHQALGTTLYFMGEFIASRHHLETGVALTDEKRIVVAAHFSEAPQVRCRAFLAQDLWYLGYADQALKQAQEGATFAKEVHHPHSVATALYYLGRVHLLRREAAATYEHVEELTKLCAKYGFVQWQAYGNFQRGWALAAKGQRREGLAQMHLSLADAVSMGAGSVQPIAMPLLADMHRIVGQLDEARGLLAEASKISTELGQHHYDAELHRLKGELLLSERKPDLREAADCFGNALDIARGQHAKSLELRAATSLALLWTDQGKRAEARDLLAPVYDWFTEGFDTADLEDARALLDQLR